MSDATPEEQAAQTAAAAQEAAEQEERTRAEHAEWEHADAVVDEWEDESFPASDPPAH